MSILLLILNLPMLNCFSLCLFFLLNCIYFSNNYNLNHFLIFSQNQTFVLIKNLSKILPWLPIKFFTTAYLIFDLMSRNSVLKFLKTSSFTLTLSYKIYFLKNCRFSTLMYHVFTPLHISICILLHFSTADTLNHSCQLS